MSGWGLWAMTHMLESVVFSCVVYGMSHASTSSTSGLLPHSPLIRSLAPIILSKTGGVWTQCFILRVTPRRGGGRREEERAGGAGGGCGGGVFLPFSLHLSDARGANDGSPFPIDVVPTAVAEVSVWPRKVCCVSLSLSVLVVCQSPLSCLPVRKRITRINEITNNVTCWCFLIFCLFFLGIARSTGARVGENRSTIAILKSPYVSNTYGTHFL